MGDVINSAQEESASRFVQSVRVLSYHSVVNQLSRNCNYASWAHRAVSHVGIHVYMVREIHLLSDFVRDEPIDISVWLISL